MNSTNDPREHAIDGFLFCLGVNHKTSSIDLREKFFLSPVEKDLLLSEWRNNPRVLGAFVLSTCNRTELYCHLLTEEPQEILSILFRVKKIEQTPVLYDHFYLYRSGEAVRHLFRVSAGLDSVVLGEKQILGQVKESADTARQKGLMSREMNILTNLAVRAGKKAQTETEIGFGGSSVSWAAVTAMHKRLSGLNGKSVLIIGAGKMGSLAVEQLKNKNVGTVYVMNRNCEKAETVAGQIDGQAVGYWQLKEILTRVDACVCSAGAPHFLIEKALVKEVTALRSGRQLVLVDISMPRNIDPSVAGLPGIELLTIDQLEEVVEESVHRRQKAVAAVEQIIENKQNEFFGKLVRLRLNSEADVSIAV